MVSIIPRIPTAWEKFGQNVSQGIGSGIESISNIQQNKKKLGQIEAENESLRKQGIDLSGIEDPKMRQLYVSASLQGANSRELQSIKEEAKNQRMLEDQQFLSQLLGQDKENKNISKQLMSGNEHNPTDENIPWYERKDNNGKSFMDTEFSEPTQKEDKSGFDASKLSDEQIAMATARSPQLGASLQKAKDVALREKREEIKAKQSLEAEERGNRTKKEAAYFKFNEPKLAEIAGIERKINVDNARFGRLQELFSDESKFPSPLLAALVTKDGSINDVAYSQLTPEAQEAVKLIIDSTSGIKDTYGARVTNFDLQTYLRKLPSLMMSAEGRNRVIRDLKSINDINQTYNEGIQDIFENSGGSDQISFSEAERRFKKEYGNELQRKIDKFITPDKNIFDKLPNAKKYLGEILQDEDTGEMFISDGVEWKPFEGEI